MVEWVKLPSAWIEARGLARLQWAVGKSDNTAALMALTAIAHHVHPQTGIAVATYDKLCAATGLSRAKLSSGLKVLDSIGVLTRIGDRSTYALANYDTQQGWAKFPAKSMYSNGRISAFADFHLRRVAELDALKVFFLFISRRNRHTNLAHIGYEKIEEYAGVKRVRIKTAISLLAHHSLVYVEHIPKESEPGVSNAYRIVGVESYKHMGTRGRGMDAVELVMS